MNLQQEYYQTTSPILLILFNRWDTALQVLEAIGQAKPGTLYISADGPRTSRLGEDLKCLETKIKVLVAIDWECEVKTFFREENVGPKEAISSAISWMFEHEEQGIVLEHDCLPSNDFFKFCDQLLYKYKFDSRIWLISGSNFQSRETKWGDGSYYYSNLTNGWGWATWKRSWELYDKDLKKYNTDEVRTQLEKVFNDKLIVDRWEEIFNQTKGNQIDTWDYQATFTHLFNHSLNIVSNYNLVSNIGFGEFAENTLDANSVFANVPYERLPDLVHPTYMLPEIGADRRTLYEEFHIADKLAEIQNQNKPRRRFKRWLKSLFVKKSLPS